MAYVPQIEEKKEFKEKEARIAAISKGNELIKTEVLIKLRAAATQLDAAPRPAPAADADDAAPATDADAGKKAQRKRKISEKVTSYFILFHCCTFFVFSRYPILVFSR